MIWSVGTLTIIVAIFGLWIKLFNDAKEAQKENLKQQIENLKQQLDWANKNNDVAISDMHMKRVDNMKVVLGEKDKILEEKEKILHDKEKQLELSQEFISEIQRLLNDNKQELDLKTRLNKYVLNENKKLELKAVELEKEKNDLSKLLESKKNVSPLNIGQYQTSL